jgi:hypothetical protein
MKTFSTAFLFAGLFLSACSGTKGSDSITQGIRGTVAEAVGNQMPSPDVKPSGPQPVATTVYVFELTNMTQVQRQAGEPFYTSIATRQVDSVKSDKEGKFALALEPGRYSIFTRVDGRWYANLFDGANNIQPVTVEAGKVTETKIVISAKAFY